MIRRFTPADADARARAYLAQLKRGQVDSAEMRIAPQLVTGETRGELSRIAAILGDREFDSSAVVGASVGSIDGVRHTNLTYEFHSAAGWVLANVAMVDTADSWLVEGASARPLPRSLEEDSAFTLAGKSARHYLWLAFAVLAVVITVGTALFLATRRAMPKRWRWVLLSLVSIGAFTLNWTTGQIAVRLVNVQLFGGGFFRLGSAAPWMITLAIPAGALLAIAHYRRWRAASVVASGIGVESSQPSVQLEPDQPSIE